MKTIITHPNFDFLGDKISTNLWITKWDVDYSKFWDNWPNFFIKNSREIIAEVDEVTYIWDFSSPEFIFDNYIIIRWILDYWASKLRIIMPFFPVGTMERINIEWEIATARYFADIFSNLPSGRRWKTSIHIFDIHALSERFFFDPYKVNVALHSVMPIFKDKISSDSVIVFPDDWAKKRYKNDFPWHEIIVCNKTRIWDKREVIISEWNPKDKHLLIIDDLIQSWWTIVETAKMLKEKWWKEVSAFATHWVFPKKSHENLVKYLDKLYVTESIPRNIWYAEKIENMEIMSIQSMIEKLITK